MHQHGPEQRRRAKALFSEACELPEDQRARLLDERCAGDSSLRSAVEALLASHDRAGRFMASRLIALVEHPAAEGDGAGVDVTTRRRLGATASRETRPGPAAGE